MSKNSLSKIGSSQSQENAFLNNSNETLSMTDKANYSTINTSGHKYENSIQSQFLKGLNGIPPPPIPPRSAGKHQENVNNI